MTTRILKQSDILKCPHAILTPSHYRNDGTCRCDDPSAKEMAEWGYVWEDGRWVAPPEDTDEENPDA